MSDLTRYGDMASLTQLREMLDSGRYPHGPRRTELLECLRSIKKAPPCKLHANHGMMICTKCLKLILCMKCDSIPCQCSYVCMDEDL